MSAITFPDARLARKSLLSTIATAFTAALALMTNIAIIAFAIYVFSKPDKTEIKEQHSPYFEWLTPKPASTRAVTPARPALQSASQSVSLEHFR